MATCENDVQVEGVKKGLELEFSSSEKVQNRLYASHIQQYIQIYTDIQVQNVKLQGWDSVQVFGSYKYMKRADIHAHIPRYTANIYPKRDWAELKQLQRNWPNKGPISLSLLPLYLFNYV
ncbi:hypothetical protein AABB24_029700 [Solanum stoloniferum]|uniref:Uncharacterized protein n=1 Tax=Solanum stoloniferum TaxID=62892 RepID=A0ABD2S0X6_9SOLN